MRALLYEGAISSNERLKAAGERGAEANLALVSAAHRRRLESFRAAKFGPTKRTTCCTPAGGGKATAAARALAASRRPYWPPEAAC